MTLPATARQLRAGNDRPAAAQLSRRKTACLTNGAWADANSRAPTTRAQARRSWHVGYGALHDVEEAAVVAVAGALNGATRRAEGCKKG